MNLSDDGLQFIANFEGLRLTLYNDDWKPSNVSQGNATIGVGHLVHTGPINGDPSEAPFANGITEQQALDLFRVDAQSRVDAVLALTPNLNENQLTAMVDFTYNCGIGAYKQWIAPVVNQGGDVCSALLPFVNPAWAHDALLRRRQAECALFNTEEDGVSQAQYDELRGDIAAVLTQLGALGQRIDKQNAEIITQTWLAANGRNDELKARIQYEATATGTKLP